MPRPMKIDYDTGQFVFLRNGTWTPDIPPDYVWSLEKKERSRSFPIHRPDVYRFRTCKKSDDGKNKTFFFRYYRL